MPLGSYWCEHNALLIPTLKKTPNNRNIINIGNNENLSVLKGIMKDTINNDKYRTISKAKEASMKFQKTKNRKIIEATTKATSINTVIVKKRAKPLYCSYWH